MRRCLVVDDSRVIRTIACRILKEFEITGEGVEDGASALHACRTDMPDLLLLDADAPGLNCAEFVRTLRRENGGDKPLFLYCVTANDVPPIRPILHPGAKHYILKPYDRVPIRNR